MLISELIEALQEQQNIHGDIPVHALGGENGEWFHNTESVSANAVGTECYINIR